MHLFEQHKRKHVVKSQQLPASKTLMNCDVSLLPAYIAPFPFDFKKDFLFLVRKMLPKQVRQNIVLIFTASTFSESLAKLITINTKSCPFFKRPTELGYN